MKNHYEGVKKIYADYNIILAPLPFGSWFNVDLSEMLATDVDWPSNIPDGNEIYNALLKKYDGIWNNVEPSLIKTKELIQERVEEAAEDLRKQTENILDGSNIPDLLPKDYNPPQFTGATGYNSTIDFEESKHLNASKVRTSKAIFP